MSGGPRILITNDDGVDAPGIAVMRKIAAELSDDVFVVAPASNQSGAGHRFTFGHELALEEREPNVFAMEASPADCVVIGCTHLLKDRGPDIVLSGVNNGQNLGDIIHCSGTAAGAREGAMQGALGIALSQAVDYERNREVDFTCAERHGSEVVRRLMKAEAGRDVYFNVNFPLGRAEDVKGIRVVPHQRFSRSPFRYYASHNDGKFFVAIPETPMPLDPERDFHVLHHDRAITVTPLSLEQTDMRTAERLRGAIMRQDVGT